MSHILDRPIWSALATDHAALAEGGKLARRYPTAISTFAATGADDPESLSALANLVPVGETVFIVHSGDIVVPRGMERTSSAELVQMVADRPVPPVADERIQLLTAPDAEEMLDLALLTKPGPFTLRAQSLGAFWGIRIGGRLAAMAGQRLRQTGYVELSGVCSHPDFRGRGLGRLLSLYVAGKIIEEGARPYLHSYAANGNAIGLYESIGFRVRSAMNGALVKRLS
jgi:predicted GNAT family acetyltransferase